MVVKRRRKTWGRMGWRGPCALQPWGSLLCSVTSEGTRPNFRRTRARAARGVIIMQQKKVYSKLYIIELGRPPGLARGCVCLPGLRTSSRVGVQCPHIWVFGKIAYLPTPRPTMTTILVQSEHPTYLPPLPRARENSGLFYRQTLKIVIHVLPDFILKNKYPHSNRSPISSRI